MSNLDKLLDRTFWGILQEFLKGIVRVKWNLLIKHIQTMRKVLLEVQEATEGQENPTRNMVLLKEEILEHEEPQIV